MAGGHARQLPMEIQNPAVQTDIGKIAGTGFIFSAECCRMARWQTLDRQFKPHVAHADSQNHIRSLMSLLSKPKDDDDVMMGMRDQGFAKKSKKA